MKNLRNLSEWVKYFEIKLDQVDSEWRTCYVTGLTCHYDRAAWQQTQNQWRHNDRAAWQQTQNQWRHNGPITWPSLGPHISARKLEDRSPEVRQIFPLNRGVNTTKIVAVQCSSSSLRIVWAAPEDWAARSLTDYRKVRWEYPLLPNRTEHLPKPFCVNSFSYLE